ncbi:MAG: HD domain-containing protein [Erythrobacter sp.]
MMKPLYLLANEGKQPDSQVMDRETAEWLRGEALERFDGRTDICPERVGRLRDIDIDHCAAGLRCRSEYDNPLISEGIHGFRHSLRVALYSQVLGTYCDVAPNWLLWAAWCHDLCRQNDRGDIGHGSRAARKFEIEWERGRVASDIGHDGAQAIAAMIRYHDLEFDQVPERIMSKFANEIAVFKAADALDRARLPKLKWWANPQFFQFSEAAQYINLCSLITTTHEVICLQDKEIRFSNGLKKSINDVLNFPN